MKRVFLSIMGLAAAGASIPTDLWAQQTAEPYRYGYGPQMMNWGGGDWGGMIFGPLMMILVLAVVIAVIVLMVRWIGGPSHGWHHGNPGRRPLDILKERYARGEIDKAEFEERRRVLGD